MLKSKTTILIGLFLISSHSYGIAMEYAEAHASMECNENELQENEDEWGEEECDEADKPKPSPKYLEEAQSKLIDYIQQGDVHSFNKMIQELSEKVISKEIKKLLTSRNERSGEAIPNIVESLPEYHDQEYILQTLQNHGVSRLISDEHFETRQLDLQNGLLKKHKDLMNSIESGIIESVQEVLRRAYNEYVYALFAANDTEKKYPVINNFQLIVLLNESDSTNGHTPLTLAIEKGFLHIAELLLINGAKHTVPNKNGMKPADIAFKTLRIDKHDFYKMFNIKETISEILDRYLQSPQYLELEQKAEEHKKKRAAKGKGVNKYLKN